MSIMTLIIIVVTLAFSPLLCYFAVMWWAKGRVFTNVNNLPRNDVGMVLGTNPNTRSGRANVFFTYRIDATMQLYQAGKIKFVLISGDNSRKDYSEPDVMKAELVKRGVPAEVVYLDYAGFRTWDSVIRAKKIFGQTNLTVISQRFHVERSIVIGDGNGMKLIGFCAKDVAFRWKRIRIYIREAFARIKIFVDLTIRKQPKFLGNIIKIGDGKPQTETN